MDKRHNINNAINYIENNLESEISVQNISKESGLSTYHFQRIFQSIVGDPVSTYIRNRRLTCAAYKLIYTRIKIIDIAMDSCFGSHEAFIHCFKSYFSVSPSYFRENKPSFIPYNRVDVFAVKENLISNNLEYKGTTNITSLILKGYKEVLEVSDFSISRKIIKKGKSIFENTNGQSHYYCISEHLDNNCYNYFIGVESPDTSNVKADIFNLSNSDCLEFKYRGITRSISEALIFLKETWLPSKSIADKGIFIEKHPVSSNKSDYVTTILVPV